MGVICGCPYVKFASLRVTKIQAKIVKSKSSLETTIDVLEFCYVLPSRML